MKLRSTLTRSFRVGLLLGSFATAAVSSQTLWMADAKAESAVKLGVAVGAFEGNRSGEVRRFFIDALKKDGNYDVTDAEDLKALAKPGALAAAAKALGVSAITTGRVSKGFALRVRVVNGLDGKLVREIEIKGGALPKLKANIEQSGVSSVAPALAKTKVEEKVEEKPTDNERESDGKSETSGPTHARSDSEGLSPLDITAGLRPLHRKFAFHDTLADTRPGAGFAQLWRYELPLGPVLFVDLNWFPASHATTGAAEWFGLTAGFEKGIATRSVYAEKTTLSTSEQAFYGGARFRVPVGNHLLGASATYGQHSFTVSPHPTLGLLIPDVKYSYVRPELYGTFGFGDLTLGAHVGKRFVLSTGSLGTLWFPNVKTQSLEAGVQVGYRLTPMLELVAGFDWLRYAFDFNPVPIGHPVVAGGAVDDYLWGTIALRFRLPGQREIKQ